MENKLLPKILGVINLSVFISRIYSLPTRLGGLGVDDPSVNSTHHYLNSIKMCEPFQLDLPINEVINIQKVTSGQIERENKEILENTKNQIVDILDTTSKQIMENNSTVGASAWLTTKLYARDYFYLNHKDFQYAITVFYGWTPQNTRSIWACGVLVVHNICYPAKLGASLL
ncbi:hypothetical protein GJ496_002943 [Pomphorhynchus laevis]|nr:hypothetical protein GJ496_002943 [Pomphorhynchus laevis]